MDIPRIDPFVKRKPCECTICGSPICVVSREMIESILNGEGQTINTKIISSKDIGYCPRCNIEYPNIHKRGLFFDLRDPI